MSESDPANAPFDPDSPIGPDQEKPAAKKKLRIKVEEGGNISVADMPEVRAMMYKRGFADPRIDREAGRAVYDMNDPVNQKALRKYGSSKILAEVERKKIAAGSDVEIVGEPGKPAPARDIDPVAKQASRTLGLQDDFQRLDMNDPEAVKNFRRKVLRTINEKANAHDERVFGPNRQDPYEALASAARKVLRETGMDANNAKAEVEAARRALKGDAAYQSPEEIAARKDAEKRQAEAEAARERVEAARRAEAAEKARVQSEELQGNGRTGTARAKRTCDALPRWKRGILAFVKPWI